MKTHILFALAAVATYAAVNYVTGKYLKQLSPIQTAVTVAWGVALLGVPVLCIA